MAPENPQLIDISLLPDYDSSMRYARLFWRETPCLGHSAFSI